MKTFVLLLLLTLLLITASCKKSEVTRTESAANSNAYRDASGTSSTPPFATKEPERYQAVRVITTSEGAETNAQATPEPGSRTFIARDGDRRREDYETEAGEKISYLQLPEGNYVLRPAKKLYAELKPGGVGVDGERTASAPPDFSPDKLLNEARPESRYEKLGAETLNGRATVKYRVTVMGKTGAGREVTTESIVWVDETLGMPVKTEATSTGGAATTGTRVVMELRDIKETIDAGLFELPSDYRRVEMRELFTQANRAASSATGQSDAGKDRD
jgi:outer membrane lipoprotein-sorting protein